MTIKQQGGIFGRNPSFNNVDVVDLTVSNDLSVADDLSVVGQLTVTGGGTSAPSYSFVGDTDTGLSKPTTNAVNIVTGGNEIARFTSSGIDLKYGSLKVINGQGIDFSATSGTGTSELFDDYEEGIFTPTWTPASGSGATVSSASGWYTKTGNRVFVDIWLATNGHGTSSGNLTLGGLPFAQANIGQLASLSIGQAANAGLVAGQSCTARINQSATTIIPLVWSATTGTTTMTAAQWGVSGTWRFTGSYQTA